jgi:electron transfer flavoprotein beta subunit
MIAVALVKSVPLGAGTLRMAVDGLSRDGVAHGLDAANELAIEWGLRERDAGRLDELVTLAMAPDDARGALQTALALGCDRAIQVTDGALRGADLRLTVSVLAEVLNRLQADLVLCGYESGDGSAGIVPAALASSMGSSLVSRALSAQITDGGVRAERDEGQGRQTRSVPMPAVLSFVGGDIEARRPTLKNAIAAKKRKIETFDLAAVGDVGSFKSPGEEVVAVRALEEKASDPLVLDLEDGLSHVAALLEQS